MDDIYDNLENYDDFNKIDELKNENEELKRKITEYTSTIMNLQTDFDNLSAEHKRMERNYSSLLKTARAEIERKTHMIKELNLEKDKLVINTRLNQHKNISKEFKREKYRSSGEKKFYWSSFPQKQEQVAIIKDTLQKDRCATESDENLPSADLIHTRNEYVVNEAGNYLRGRNVTSEDKSFTSKENDVELSNRHTDTVIKKVTDRRKSVSVLSHEKKLSTDEECEYSQKKDENKMRHKSKDEAFKHSPERKFCNNKETFGTENELSQRQEHLSRNYSRNQYYYNDRQRSQDQHSSSQKHKKYRSPDSYRRRSREKKDDYYQRNEYNHQRAYDNRTHEKSYRHSSSSDRRSDFCSRESRYDNKTHAEKHKPQNELDEPICKRQKIDYDYRHIHEDRQQKELDCGKAPLPMPLSDMMSCNDSCQSPEFAHSEYNPRPAIKEIRNTAITPLEDPRLSSRNYMIINDNGKEVLSTINGRNVDIIPTNSWYSKPVPMPSALCEAPPDFVIKFDKSGYSESDKHSSGTSEDSLVITDHSSDRLHHQSGEVSVNFKNNDKDDCVIEHNFKEKRDIETIGESNQNNIDSSKLNTQTITNINESNTCIKAFSAYKIPKLKKNNEVSHGNSETNVNIENLSKEVKNNETVIPDKSKISLDDKSLPQHATCPEKSVIENKYDDIVTSSKIVEADLVLSDDPVDIIEPERTTYKKQRKSKCEKNKTKEHSEKKSNKLDTKKSAKSSKILYENVEVVKGDEIQSSVEEDKDKMARKSSKHGKRSRKKTEESHNSDPNPSEVTKTEKSRKEEDKTKKEIKTKFVDLFGESSSLAPAEDIGIVTLPKAKEEFVTILENTEDAVDLNFKEMEKVMTKIGNSQERPSEKDQNHSIEAHTNCATTEKSNNDDALKDSLTSRNVSRSNEIRTDFTHQQKIIEEKGDAVKTVIISMGRQPQFDLRNEPEPLHPGVASIDKTVQRFVGMKALATSTPAKPTQHEQTNPVPIDDLNTDSTNSRDHSTNRDGDKNHAKDSDLPDVRLIVKRRKKMKVSL